MTDEREEQILESVPPWVGRSIAQSMAVSASLLILATGVGEIEACEVMIRLFGRQIKECELAERPGAVREGGMNDG